MALSLKDIQRRGGFTTRQAKALETLTASTGTYLHVVQAGSDADAVRPDGAAAVYWVCDADVVPVNALVDVDLVNTAGTLTVASASSGPNPAGFISPDESYGYAAGRVHVPSGYVVPSAPGGQIYLLPDVDPITFDYLDNTPAAYNQGATVDVEGIYVAVNFIWAPGDPLPTWPVEFTPT